MFWPAGTRDRNKNFIDQGYCFEMFLWLSSHFLIKDLRVTTSGIGCTQQRQVSYFARVARNASVIKGTKVACSRCPRNMIKEGASTLRPAVTLYRAFYGRVPLRVTDASRNVRWKKERIYGHFKQILSLNFILWFFLPGGERLACWEETCF